MPSFCTKQKYFYRFNDKAVFFIWFNSKTVCLFYIFIIKLIFVSVLSLAFAELTGL